MLQYISIIKNLPAPTIYRRNRPCANEMGLFRNAIQNDETLIGIGNVVFVFVIWSKASVI